MRRKTRSLLGVAAAAVLGWVGSTGQAAAEYPVDYNFFGGIVPELTNPGGSLPGANDFGCVPSPAHPNPVVLAHGTAGGAQTNWGTYVALLANEGYCVYSLTYGAYDLPWPLSALGGMRPIQENAAEFGAFVDRVRAASGAAKVDIVSHSQGSLVANYYVKRLGGARVVDKVVSIAGPWLGVFGDQMSVVRAIGQRLGIAPDEIDATVSGGICLACAQLVGGSAFLSELNADGVYAPDVEYTNIATVYDEIAFPYTSGLVEAPNATNIVVQHGCPTDFSDHLGIAGSPRAAAYVLNALDPAHPRTPPCEFVPPFTG
ncbi:esterase/lipase family protein [Nocardia sp. NPDC059177]|uniref:esterase/lipase family protein n=1 Tax=Nocardia sp. NPDC059177 TaxID=3346759 RepID=UPI0036B103B2